MHTRGALTAGALTAAGWIVGGCELVAGLGGEQPYPADGGTSSSSSGTGGNVSSCSNGLKDANETDKDCGGSCPDACGNGKGCDTGSDCASQVCTGNTCVVPACQDKAKNGQETDVDCGGPTCPKCANDKACAVPADCTSAICESGACVNPLVWQHQYPAAFAGLATDGSGNAVVAGSYSGTVDFGGGSLTSGTMGPDGFVLELGPTGSHLWSKPFHGTSQRRINDIATYDASTPSTAGDVAIAGSFQGTIDFGSKTLQSAGSLDAFALTLDTAGNIPSFILPTKYGDALTQDGRAIAVSNGYVANAGTFSGSIDFGSKMYTTQTTFASQSGAGDLYLGELTVGLKLLWGKSFTGPTSIGNVRVAVDTAHNVIFAASFRNHVDFGGGQLTATGSANDVFIAKFDDKGVHLWSHRYGDSADQTVTGIAVDGSDNILVAGHFAGAIDFGNGALTSTGTSDMFVAKLDTMGNQLWSKSAAHSLATGIAVDPMGRVVITGEFDADTDFGGGMLTNAGGRDIFVAKYDAAGNHLWSHGFGDSQNQFAGDSNMGGIAAPDATSVLVAGNFGGLLDFGGGAMVSATGTDVYLAKLRTP